MTSPPNQKAKAVPDFLVWHCAGCGAPAVGKVKPCECATNVGTRGGPHGNREQTWWDDPPDPLLTRITALEEALRKLWREHFACNDGWYSCPKCEEGCLNPDDGDACNCGADKHNAIIDAALEGKQA